MLEARKRKGAAAPAWVTNSDECHLTAIRMTVIKHTENSKCGRGCRNPHAQLLGVSKGVATVENTLAVPQQAEHGHHMTSNSALCINLR